MIKIFNILKKNISIFTLLLSLFISGCVLGPDYQAPTTSVPIQYKNNTSWKKATPSDHQDKGSWWEIYNDKTLNKLEIQAGKANQTLKAASARLTQAKAEVGANRAAKSPNLDLTGNAKRSRVLLNRYGFNSGSTGILFNYYDFSSVLNYEIDLFGRVKRSVEAAEASAESATADYRTLLLVLQADLASKYFALRSTDNEISLLEQALELRKEYHAIIQKRYKYGIVGLRETLLAKAELDSTKAELVGLQKQRGELENSIALLIGQMPSTFTLDPAPFELTVPAITPGLPSSLLERRPDVASAERQMAATSARIGVAKAAFFPAISLSGNAGFGSSQLAGLFNWDNRTWALGPALSLPIFDGGRKSNNLKQARAAYEEAVANYRQQVLVAFQEAEDGLHGLQTLRQQGQELQKAVDDYTQIWHISEKRYKAGLVSSLEVINDRFPVLTVERLYSQIHGQQMIASVLLIKALGGSWKAD